jgi:hypothetical protein
MNFTENSTKTTARPIAPLSVARRIAGDAELLRQMIQFVPTA